MVALLALLLWTGLTEPATVLAIGDTVTANDCAIAAGGNATGNFITCTYGLRPEQVQELTEAAAKGATEPLVGKIVELSKVLGITEDATKTLLRIVGEQEVPLERLSETLNKVANDYKRLQQQLAVLDPSNPTAHALTERARVETNVGRFDEARRLLKEATQAQIAAAQQARQLREQAEAAEDAQLLGAAASTAAQADLAMTERQYLEAAELFRQAAELVPMGHLDKNKDYLRRQADALYSHGHERGDNVTLAEAIKVNKHLLQHYSREQEPLGWATAQNLLGIALRSLGERESGTARLEEAVAAYRAALEERTRERVPLDWAATQNNLGSALRSLGLRERTTTRLEEAVVAYRAALEERTRERVPLDWAMTQMNLGTALASLGERESSTARLEEAIACLHDALGVYQQSQDAYSLPIVQQRLVELEAQASKLKRSATVSNRSP